MATRATSGTLRIITAPVGKGQGNAKDDARSVQQLLMLAGAQIKADGNWGDKSQAALISFQKKCLSTAPSGTFPAGKALDVIPVGSPVLTLLAHEAGLLLPFIGEQGIDGVQRLHDWLVAQKVRYQTGAEKGLGNRAVWGMFGDRTLGVQTTGPQKHFYGPLLLDCTTYVNMMLAIYHEGNLHGTYNAALNDTGGGDIGTEHLGKSRWDYSLVTYPATNGRNYHQNLGEILEATEDKSEKMFYLEVGGTHTNKDTGAVTYGFVTHMALLYGGIVYECTPRPIMYGSACISRPLGQFMSNKSMIYVFEEP